MKCIAAVLLCGVVVTSAFNVRPTFTPVKRRAPSALYYHPEKFERAVECAQKYGLCNVDELEELASDLEKYQGCFYETDDESCDKEISDRKDVAEVLRLQSELKLRQDYLQEANLFAGDVGEEHNQHEREDFMEIVQGFQSW